MPETPDYDKSATPTAHKTTHQDGGTDEISVQGLSGLLADGQTPLAHKASHQDGTDEISVAALSGQLADAQPSTWTLVAGKPTTFAPEAHKTNHQDGGTDEISVQGLSGLLADDQHVLDTEAVLAMGAKASTNPLNHDRYADSEALAAAVQSGAITDGVTKAPTHDAVYDVKVMTEAHKTRHEDGGADEISVEGLSGKLADYQKGYVDRGDPAATDWTKASFTTDGAAHQLNCSSIVPAGIRFITFRLSILDDVVGTYFSMRKNGNSNWINSGGLTIQVANVANFAQFRIPCDQNGIIEYIASNVSFTAITLGIMGWEF